MYLLSANASEIDILKRHFTQNNTIFGIRRIQASHSFFVFFKANTVSLPTVSQELVSLFLLFTRPMQFPLSEKVKITHSRVITELKSPNRKKSA